VLAEAQWGLLGPFYSLVVDWIWGNFIQIGMCNTYTQLLATIKTNNMNSYLIKILLILSILFFQSCENNDDIFIDNSDEFEEYLMDQMEFQKIPAMSVLIFNENKVLLERNLGLSNIRNNISLEPDHLFLLASISKVVTATALLQLNESNLFSLDDNINDYLPFDFNVPNYSESITFKMLLTHTSAIADGSALDSQYYYGEDSPVELDYFLENYLVQGGKFYNASDNFYDFEPGTEYEYSNIGNALIGLLVEEISGMNFSEYCKKNIFNPLGMTQTFWRLDEINQMIVQPYIYANGGYEEIQHYTFTDYPNGGLRSISRDLYKFLTAFVNDGWSNNFQLLSSNTISEMITPQIPDLDNEVGLHLFNLNSENQLWGHDGGEQGVATIMAFNPSTKVGAIILTNQGDSDLDEILVEAYKLGLNL
jgi:CubicO group peptidase (beta-lactamase class C family)